MKTVYFLIILYLFSSCSWIQSQRNESIFDSEEYKQEEVLAYVHLLEQISNPSKYYRDGKPRKFLFFVRTDSLAGWEKAKENNEYLFGEIKTRKLNLDEMNRYESLKVLLVPDTTNSIENRKIEEIYWKYREEYSTTIDVFSLSRIVFNESYTQGILNYWYSCGSLCGEGCTLYIKKIDGKWVVEQKEHCIMA